VTLRQKYLGKAPGSQQSRKRTKTKINAIPPGEEQHSTAAATTTT
jgi:hypothetical protein